MAPPREPPAADVLPSTTPSRLEPEAAGAELAVLVDDMADIAERFESV